MIKLSKFLKRDLKRDTGTAIILMEKCDKLSKDIYKHLGLNVWISSSIQYRPMSNNGNQISILISEWTKNESDPYAIDDLKLEAYYLDKILTNNKDFISCVARLEARIDDAIRIESRRVARESV